MKFISAITTSLTLAILLTLASPTTGNAKPIKVFILAGQSNMEGHAKIETFDYIGDDPATAPLLTKCETRTAAPTFVKERGFPISRAEVTTMEKDSAN